MTHSIMPVTVTTRTPQERQTTRQGTYTQVVYTQATVVLTHLSILRPSQLHSLTQLTNGA